MMQTLLLVALACAALLPIVLPLLRGARAPEAPASESDQAVYRDQLRELDRDIARGLLTDAEARASRVEIQRRLLAAARTSAPAATPTPSPTLGLLVVGLVSIGSISLYAVLGEPARQPAPANDRRAEVERMAEQLRAKLAADPTSQEGWRLLGRANAALGDWGGAIAAYERAMTLGDRSADTVAAVGEVLVARAGGTVIPPAREAFRAALTIDPTHGMARFYLALADGQDGKQQDAIAALRVLAGEVPAGSPVRAEITRRIAAFAAEAGIPPPTLPEGTAQEPGPDQATMEAAANLPQAERLQLIRGMVARLAERLDANPADVDGWLRLARSYGVLGEQEKSADAFERAAALRPGDVSIPLQAFEALLHGLAVTDKLPPRAIAILRRIAVDRPDEPAVLWYLGLVAAREGRKPEALTYWRRLRDSLPAGHSDAEMVRSAIAVLEGTTPSR